jgi:hypothetical protein
MSQNRSSAVMQQRSEPNDSLDDFPTPPWATRALCEWLHHRGYPISFQSCREPAANRGHMAKPLSEHFGAVMASDVFDYGAGFPVLDYLFGPASHLERSDWTITNPPFALAEQFIDRALDLSNIGCAMLVRTAFAEGQDRFHSLFSKRPPSFELVFSERVVMLKGRLIQAGAIDPLAEKENTKASTATAYVWMIWLKHEPAADHWPYQTIKIWIPPCRWRLERPGDYPNYSTGRHIPPTNDLFGERAVA